MDEIVEKGEEFDDFVSKEGGQGLVPFEVEPKVSNQMLSAAYWGVKLSKEK